MFGSFLRALLKIPFKSVSCLHLLAETNHPLLRQAVIFVLSNNILGSKALWDNLWCQKQYRYIRMFALPSKVALVFPRKGNAPIHEFMLYTAHTAMVVFKSCCILTYVVWLRKVQHDTCMSFLCLTAAANTDYSSPSSTHPPSSIHGSS
jgi:hypothetical protein